MVAAWPPLFHMSSNPIESAMLDTHHTQMDPKKGWNPTQNGLPRLLCLAYPPRARGARTLSGRADESVPRLHQERSLVWSRALERLLNDIAGIFVASNDIQLRPTTAEVTHIHS